MDYSKDLARRARNSPWQCIDCKTCCLCEDAGDAVSNVHVCVTLTRWCGSLYHCMYMYMYTSLCRHALFPARILMHLLYVWLSFMVRCVRSVSHSHVFPCCLTFCVVLYSLLLCFQCDNICCRIYSEQPGKYSLKTVNGKIVIRLPKSDVNVSSIINLYSPTNHTRQVHWVPRDSEHATHFVKLRSTPGWRLVSEDCCCCRGQCSSTHK